MMLNLRRAVVLSVACLTLFATSAAAECAWVLWVQEYLGAGTLSAETDTDTRKSDWWSLIRAEPTSEACERKLQWRIYEVLAESRRRKATVEANHLGQHHDFSRERDNVIIHLIKFDDGRFLIEVHKYFCLPDTVDPRGTKGK